MTLKQYCDINNLDIITIDFLIFAINNSDAHVSWLLDCLSKDECDKYLRLVVGENFDGNWSIRPNILKMLAIDSKKEKGNSFTKLVQKLGNDPQILDFESRFGYFFSSKDARESAKLIYETGDYDLEKTIKVVKQYYSEWSSSINPKGFYSLINSDSWNGLYNNFKERKDSTWNT